MKANEERGVRGSRWLDSITDSKDMNLRKFWEIVEDRGTWCAIVHGNTKSQTQLHDRTTTRKSSWQVCFPVVPNLFGTRGQFCGRQFLHGQGFQGDSSTLYFLCTLFLSLLHQLHLKSSGIRSQKLGTPALTF